MEIKIFLLLVLYNIFKNILDSKITYKKYPLIDKDGYEIK